MSTDLAIGQPASAPSESGPVTGRPIRNRRRWVGWLLACAFILVLFVELGPWPGTITNALGLSVSSRESWRDDAGVPAVTAPRSPSYRTGRRLTLNDGELADFARYCDGVRQTFVQLQEQSVDYSAVRSHYWSLVPELFLSLQEQKFSEEDAKQWAAYLEKSPPSRVSLPSEFNSFYEDLMRAAVLRQLTEGHLREMIRYIDWWKSVAEREDSYRRASLAVADHIPSSLWPRADMRTRWHLSGLDRARRFMLDKVERANSPTESATEAENGRTSGEAEGTSSPP